MLENARRQFILVLLTIAAALACFGTLDPILGSDLKGGTQLRYEVPQEIVDELIAKNPGTQVEDVMAQTLSVIGTRLDPDGTLDALITQVGRTGILIELPYMQADELKRVQERIANLGKLEMRIVADEQYVSGTVKFDMKEEKRRLEKWLAEGGKTLLEEDLRNIRRFNEDPQNGPQAYTHLAWYPRLITPSLDNAERWGSRSYTTDEKLGGSSVKVFDDAKDFNNGIVPDHLKQKPPRDRYLLELVALNLHERHFTGEDLDAAGVSGTVDETGGSAVAYRIKAGRDRDYAEWSEQYVGKCSAIVLNGVVKSAPYFISRIPGSGIIKGDFTQAEVDELVKVLRTGSLRVEPRLESQMNIGPKLGERSIELGAWSMVAGTLVVFAFMLWYYRLSGVVACVTLLLNVFLLWALVLFFRATITLPGLGGLVLTMGMAVDANVLIYERIREEIDRGKDLLRAVRAGFERAMSAILDSNVTTFLAGLVLYGVGIGPVRGFAVTLMIGIATTVFTQFFVTRLVFHWLIERKILTEYRTRRLVPNLNVDWARFAKPCMLGSAVFLVCGLAYALFAIPRERLLGMDFTGGANIHMVLERPLDVEVVRSTLEKDPKFGGEYRNLQVNTVGEGEGGNSEEFNIRFKLTDAQSAVIEQDRKSWSEQKRQTEAKGEQPPAVYEPPYVKELRRIFAADLRKPGFNDARVVPLPIGNRASAEITLHFQEPVEVAAAQKRLTDNRLAEVKVTVRGPDGALQPEATQGADLFVDWQTGPDTRQWELFETVRTALGDLKTVSGKPVSLSDPFPEAQEIQGRVVGELRNAAVGALILSWVLIALYLRVRFHEYRYGVAAVITLVHDVLFAFVVVALANEFGIVNAEIDLNMIACFLTIIGYSVNDTIVIFDRIRENLAENRRNGITEEMRILINRAVNQTMSRTILTTSVTMFCVLAQFLVNWGSGSALESFSFAFLMGMVSGTYSTIFIAPFLLTYLGGGKMPPTPEPVAEVAKTA